MHPIFLLPDIAKAQILQVNGGIHPAVLHFQPQHTAQDYVGAFLDQIIGLLGSLRSKIVFDGKHIRSLSVVMAFSGISRKSPYFLS